MTAQQRQRARKRRKRQARHVRRLSPEVIEDRLALAYERDFLEHQRQNRKLECMRLRGVQKLANFGAMYGGPWKTVTSRMSSSKPNITHLARTVTTSPKKGLPFQALADAYLNSGSMKLFDFKTAPMLMAPPRSGKTVLALEAYARLDAEATLDYYFEMKKYTKYTNPTNVACTSYIAEKLCRSTARFVGRCE